MKKIYFLTILFLFAFITNAQIHVQGFPRNDFQGKAIQKQTIPSANFTFANIKHWVGKGANQAAIVLQWNDNKNPEAMVWGYRWDGNATGIDMINAIAKADSRFYTLTYYSGPSLGVAVGGFGYDIDGKGAVGLYKDNNASSPYYPQDGVIKTKTYDFDAYTPIDATDHWQSGWKSKGFWGYYSRSSAEGSFSFSGVGASTRQLANGSWDLWNFTANFQSVPTASTFTAAPPDFTKGYFMINEDWYGKRNGSLNFVNNNDEVIYRPYAEANNNASFGATAQFGTIYGGNLYVVSKQAKDNDQVYTAGGRLVVIDAITLKKKAGFDKVGDGDGRSFLGVNPKTGYIGTSSGIVLFDIEKMTVGEKIAGTAGTGDLYQGQIGNMIRTATHVFAIKQDHGIFVIDPKTHSIIKTVSGSFNSIVQAKDGSVWAIQSTKLVNINTKDFSTTDYKLPTTKYDGSWGAWNAGTLTASVKENELYYFPITGWSASSTLVKFDVTTKTFNENYFKLTPLADSESIYGAGVRINPITSDFIITSTNSYTTDQIYRHNKAGVLQSSIKLNSPYYFQAMPVFPDIFAPVVSSDFPSEIAINTETKINLKNVATDEDNISAAIVKSVRSNSKDTSVKVEINADQELVLTPLSSGVANIEIDFTSNGKVATKSIAVTSNYLATTETTKALFKIYPNPVSDVLKVKSDDKIVTINIFDVTGRLVLSKSNANEINVSQVAKGNYVVQIVTNQKIYTEKFIKK